jgi:hypothetical protein
MPLLPPLSTISQIFAVKRWATGTLLAISFMAGAGVEQCQAQSSAGTSSKVSIPAWVPIYPGAKVGVAKTSSPGVQTTIWFTVSTDDPCARVTKFYEERLTLAGFSIVRGSMGDGCVGTLRAHDPAGREINLSGGKMVSGTRYELEVTQLSGADQSSRPAYGRRQDSSAGNGEIPSWVPIYRQWAPRNISTRQSGRDYFVSFTFNTHDDARSILSWYQDQLRQAGLRADMDVAGSAGALRSSTRDNRRALKIEVSASGSQNVVLLEVREER